MFRRVVSLPAGTESVWRAITDPGAVEDWFGASVEWDLRPGGQARFRHVTGGGDRDGVIDDVDPGRTLRFRWWSAEEGGDASEVAYELEPDGAGTRLTVTERQLAVPAEALDDAARPSTVAYLAPAPAAGAGGWTLADQALWETWAGAGGRSALMAAVGRAR